MAFNSLPIEVSKPPCNHPHRGVTPFAIVHSYLCVPLGIQLNEQIATCLDTDREVCNFRRICHATNAAVETYRCGVWRVRYARRYDMPEKVGGRRVSMIYKIRSKLLRKSAKFVMGQDPREIRCMEILRDLVVGEREPTVYRDAPKYRTKRFYENHMQTYRSVARPCALRTTSQKSSALCSARASSERLLSAYKGTAASIRS